MKFDLVEINRLSPPGLWDLGALASVIAMLRGVIVSGHGSVLVYGRMVVRYSESLREKTRDNLNMRIKAWVLQCPIRTAHVRHMIGEMAIRHWRKNRLADYALTRYFGDWKRKFPHGFRNGGFANNDTQSRRQSALQFTHSTRAYKWKLFALVKIVNVQGFLYGKSVPNPEEQDLRDAYYKLWGVDIGDDEALRKWTQPRGARTLNPIRFTPYELELDELELEPEERAEAAPSIVITQDVPKRIEGETSSTEKLDEFSPHKKPP